MQSKTSFQRSPLALRFQSAFVASGTGGSPMVRRYKYMQDVESLLSEFIINVDQIAKMLVEGFGLKHSGTISHLDTPVLRWLDFRLRFIDPRPRQIFLSNRFPKTLDSIAVKALRVIETKISKGEDINQHQ